MVCRRKERRHSSAILARLEVRPGLPCTRESVGKKARRGQSLAASTRHFSSRTSLPGHGESLLTIEHGGRQSYNQPDALHHLEVPI